MERIINKLDDFLGRNDYKGAEEHILYWLSEAEKNRDNRQKLLLLNELAGLYRKLTREKDAFNAAENALALIKEMGIENNIGAGTTYLNCATVYKAFKMAGKALPLYEKAKEIYEKTLSPNDKRFGGLYNNMALALVDLGDFETAYNLYEKAISIMEKVPDGLLDVAITYLNIADAKQAEMGIEESDEIVKTYLEKSMKILDNHEKSDGYYAFVCEKCASVFGYYGFFIYQQELEQRAREIYERP